MPCVVTIAVKFGVNLILLVSLSLITGKNCFIACPFVVRSHRFCHLAMLWSLSHCTTSFLGILLKDMLHFLVASLASLSASSLPFYPGECYCPVAFFEIDCYLPDFLYAVVVIFCAQKGLECDPAVCV